MIAVRPGETLTSCNPSAAERAIRAIAGLVAIGKAMEIRTMLGTLW